MRIFLSLCIVMGLLSCQPTTTDKNDTLDTQNGYYLIGGETMGTTYSAKFKGDSAQAVNQALDSLFLAINKEVSTYIPTSVISTFNQEEKTNESLAYLLEHKHFMTNFKKAKEVYEATEGHFDPTVMPLVNYWGFGYEGEAVTQVDEAKVKDLMQWVGMDKITLTPEGQIEKTVSGVELDFSAIAKGYAVDAAAQLLEQRGIENFLIEVGGEVYTQGVNPHNKPFVIGINKPLENAPISEFTAYVGLSGKALATSGNYRNYYEVDGKKYSHTISPKTGFPQRSNLLSATIIAADCMTADAYATAAMVMGLPKAKEYITAQADLEGYFIFVNENGELESIATPGFKTLML